MKQTCLVILLLLLLAAASLLSFFYIQNTAGRLDRALAQVEQDIDNNQIQQAQLLLTGIAADWDKISHRWEILINHDDIRDIEIGFTDLDTALRQQDAAAAQKELRSLRYFVSHVPENEKIAISNIL